MPIISVIVPVYNVKNYLERCVNSLLNQSFTDFEIILVDDGSTDGCYELCNQFQSEERIVIIHKKNGGLSDARNSGIEWALKNSNSQWLAFVDSDDYVHEDYLQALYNAVIETGLHFCTCEYQGTSIDRIEVNLSNLTPIICTPESYFCKKTNMFSACTRLYLKNDFKTVRFPYGKICEDAFTIYKIMFKYEKIAVVNEPLYAYYNRADSIMREKWSPKKLDVFEAYDNQIAFYQKYSFLEAKKEVVLLYVYSLCYQIEQCEHSDNYRKVYKKKMIRMLRKHLIKYHYYTELQIKAVPWYYEITNPFMMKIYWLFKTFIDKMINNE